jgi:hypothetical protein
VTMSGGPPPSANGWSTPWRSHSRPGHPHRPPAPDRRDTR